MDGVLYLLPLLFPAALVFICQRLQTGCWRMKHVKLTARSFHCVLSLSLSTPLSLSLSYLLYGGCRYGGNRSKTQDALRRFKTDDSVAVLLIPTKSGSGGLNLTEASHVLLVEPLLNPAIELQAIGRVHRIGQTRETHVHHFLMQDTVEANVVHQQSIIRRTAHAVPLSPSKKSTAASESGSLTVGEIQNLFAPRAMPSATAEETSPGGATRSTPSSSDSAASPCAATVVKPDDVFWKQMVVFRGRDVARSEAVKRLLIAASYGGATNAATSASFSSQGDMIMIDKSYQLFGSCWPRTLAWLLLLRSPRLCLCQPHSFCLLRHGHGCTG